ncbi:replicative DNA helicase [Humisphaera borealis]|uniref:Replicative DNA helicase n=1 Tax=Humisphaera borealis TaxID=2807512 RepID=A0A7M2WQV8_9BACT|nr:replicative DNA helicase [Humisphaera borealis]QOV87856.1 replicative DNA helicase [Humisphaera borealis]
MTLIDSSIAGQFDRLPPHSAEAEMCVLASMMLDKELIGQVVQLIRGEDFFQADHQIIYDCLTKLYEQNRPIDAVIVREELGKRGLLDEIGGTAYLAQVIGTVPSSAHGAHYAAIVREKSLLRQLIAASNDILRDSYGPQETAEVVLDRAEKRIFDIAQKKVGNAMVPMEQVLHEVFEMIENRGQRGLETGFYEMDDMLNGLQPGELVIVAARPSMGKTAFAMNVIEHIAADSRMPCAVFSLEMSKQQLAQRMLCSRGQIDAHKLRKGLLQSHEYAHLANVVGELAKAPIWVDDSPGLTVLDLRAKSRRLALQHGIKAIMIDYMQLMDNPGVESRQQQISEISRGIKAVARELNVPVICLSQLNRGSENRDGHRPRMSDLRESGSIEQDADVVMLLHREDYYRMSEPDFQPDNIAEVIIAKQRNGPTGTVKLAFMNKTTRFENLSAQNDPF